MISNKKYQELLELVVGGKSLPEVSTEEEKKTGDFGIDVIMMPWIILSADKKVIIPIDVVTTIVEPIVSVKQMFIDKCEAFKITEETND